MHLCCNNMKSILKYFAFGGILTTESNQSALASLGMMPSPKWKHAFHLQSACDENVFKQYISCRYVWLKSHMF